MGFRGENKYIQSAKLNGAEYNKTWFTHEDVMKGGTLELFMETALIRSGEWEKVRILLLVSLSIDLA